MNIKFPPGKGMMIDENGQLWIRAGSGCIYRDCKAKGHTFCRELERERPEEFAKREFYYDERNKK